MNRNDEYMDYIDKQLEESRQKQIEYNIQMFFFTVDLQEKGIRLSTFLKIRKILKFFRVVK